MGQNPTEDELLALVMEVREYIPYIVYFIWSMGQNPTEDELLALVMEVREYILYIVYSIWFMGQNPTEDCLIFQYVKFVKGFIRELLYSNMLCFF